MIRKLFAGAAAIAIAIGAASSANAVTTNTVGLIGLTKGTGGASDVESGSVAANVSCTNTIDPICVGLVDAGLAFDDGFGDASFDGIFPYTADPFNLANAGDAEELTAAKAVLNDPSLALFDRRNAGQLGCMNGGEVCTSFTSSALLLLLKAGEASYFLRNQTGGEITLSFLKLPGVGNAIGGLSHVTEFNSAVIPVPAALPLFLTAFGSLGLLGWRRRQLS